MLCSANSKKCLMACVKSQALFVLLVMSHSVSAQKLATLQVIFDHPCPSAGIEIPVSTDVDAITHLPDSALTTFYIEGKKRTPVAFQIESGVYGRILTWLVQDSRHDLRFEFHTTCVSPVR